MARQCPCYASFMQERITVTIKRTNRRKPALHSTKFQQREQVFEEVTEQRYTRTLLMFFPPSLIQHSLSFSTTISPDVLQTAQILIIL